MNKTFFGIPRVIVVFLVVILAPILGMLMYVHEDMIARQTSLEKACVTKIMAMPQVVEITAAPTATPSPTVKPRLVPASQSGVVK